MSKHNLSLQAFLNGPQKGQFFLQKAYSAMRGVLAVVCIKLTAGLFVLMLPVNASAKGDLGDLGDLDLATIKPFLQTYCVECHGGKKVKGKIDFTKIVTNRDADNAFQLWEDVVDVLKHGDMPPEESKQPGENQKKVVYHWFQKRYVNALEPRAGVFRPRRLSATEFGNTLATLMGFKLEVDISEAEQTVTERSIVKKLMPPDPPGASGFKNDTENTKLSTTLWDRYALIIDGAIRELFHPSRRTHLEVYTGSIRDGITFKHAERMLKTFLPRAHRRPVDAKYLAKAIASIRRADDIEAALQFELKAALLSPRFLYRGALMPTRPGQHNVDAYELASRLSYFLWADMPDQILLDAAAGGKLKGKAAIIKQVNRMLSAPKARSLAEIFAVEWLALDEIDHVERARPEFQGPLKDQPITFMHYLFTENRPLLEMIDSRVTFANQDMRDYYASADFRRIKRVRKPQGVERMAYPVQRLQLKATTDRGGLLTMPGVLMMNKGPVIRGTWMLERIIGDHLPEPPANIGQIPQNKRGQNLTFRQRFEQHRSKSACSVCHNKIDPLGFALDGFDGRGLNIIDGPQKDNKSKKSKRAKKGQAKATKHAKIDTSGKLPSGETFKDFNELKKILVTSQRRVVIRNIVERMLSYALARKLTVYDRPVLEELTDHFAKTQGGYSELIRAIATSLPFTHAVIEDKRL